MATDEQTVEVAMSGDDASAGKAATSSSAAAHTQSSSNSTDNPTPVLRIPHIENFAFDEKPGRALPVVANNTTPLDAFWRRRREQFAKHGLRRRVEGVVLVHRHGHPHVLLLTRAKGTAAAAAAQAMGNDEFALPGGRLRVGEAPVAGLLRKLDSKLGPPDDDAADDADGDNSNDSKKGGASGLWTVTSLVAQWWRPHFDARVHPYVPPHVSAPKEQCQQFLVSINDGVYARFLCLLFCITATQCVL
jgi:hypothetical protein